MPAFSVFCGIQTDIIVNGERQLEETGDVFNLPMDDHSYAKVPIPPSCGTAGLQPAIA